MRESLEKHLTVAEELDDTILRIGETFDAVGLMGANDREPGFIMQLLQEAEKAKAELPPEQALKIAQEALRKAMGTRDRKNDYH